MGGCAFFAAVAMIVMGMGVWRETGSPGWLAASITLTVLTLVGSFVGGKKKNG